MDRFEYIDARLFEGERYLKRDKNVKIYDGEDKVIRKSKIFILAIKLYYF